MHLHQLPWPVEVLQELGELPVRVRVTLSYFVEPNPARRGWRYKHIYPSHGLRFDMRRPTESLDAFRERVNKAARDADAAAPERPRIRGPEPSWRLGERVRN